MTESDSKFAQRLSKELTLSPESGAKSLRKVARAILAECNAQSSALDYYLACISYFDFCAHRRHRSLCLDALALLPELKLLSPDNCGPYYVPKILDLLRDPLLALAHVYKSFTCIDVEERTADSDSLRCKLAALEEECLLRLYGISMPSKLPSDDEELKRCSPQLYRRLCRIRETARAGVPHDK